MLENCLSVPYLLKILVDFDQTCVSIRVDIYVLHHTLVAGHTFSSVNTVLVVYAFCCLLIFFSNQLFQKCLSRIPSEYQTVWIQILPIFKQKINTCVHNITWSDQQI